MSSILFIPITKIDEEKRLVYFRAAQEIPDRSGEIMDYASSRPYFEQWSDEQYEASMGKSYGNVRSMHNGSLVASGKLTEPLEFNDDERAIDGVAYIADDDDWSKCQNGILTGVSIGGKYVGAKKVEKTDDGRSVKRYTAAPSEISLVDRPCIPTSTFTMIKVDGTEEVRPFKTVLPDDLGKVAERDDVSDADKKAAKKEYGDVTFADSKNSKYPIDTPSHIKSAYSYISQAKNAAKYSAEDLKSIKGKIIAAWKEKIDKNGPPSAGKETKKMDIPQIVKRFREVFGADAEHPMSLKKFEPGEDLKKWIGQEVSDAASAIYALQSIIYLYAQESQETDPEDAAQVEALSIVIQKLKEFIAAEIMESDDNAPTTMKADATGDLAKAEGNGDLQKAGARHSASDAEKIQGIHDHSTALGATCSDGAAKASTAGDLKKVDNRATSANLTKLDTDITDLRKDFGEAVGMLKKVSEENEELKKRLKTLEDQPTEGGPVAKSVMVTKQQDSGGASGEIDDVALLEKLATMNGEEVSLLLAKAALSKPIPLTR